MPYVQSIKLLGSRTQHSTEEAGEQEEISTSAESVEIVAEDVTKRNFGTGGRDPYSVTGCCVVFDLDGVRRRTHAHHAVCNPMPNSR
jgi:hypothetical protein